MSSQLKIEYKPEFPYKGKQIIISSDRVHLLSKHDSVFLFGKQSIGLSTPKTIHLDASYAVVLQSPNIRLGDVNAKERVILGDTFIKELKEFLSSLTSASEYLTKVSAGSKSPTSALGSSMTYIALFGRTINSEATKLSEKLDSALSKTTLTT